MTLRTSKAPPLCGVTSCWMPSCRTAAARVSLMSDSLLEDRGDGSPEDHIEGDDEYQGDGRELCRRLVPGQPGRGRVGALLLGRLGVDETDEFGHRLGPGHHADQNADHDVDDEGHTRGEERRALPGQV